MKFFEMISNLLKSQKILFCENFVILFSLSPSLTLKLVYTTTHHLPQTFPPEGVTTGFWNLHRVLGHQKNKIRGEKIKVIKF
jgi:hypothetical protein